MPLTARRNRLLFFFWGFFVANAVIAELISVKLFDAGSAFGLQGGTFIMALGLLPWPLVFIATDLLNEFYGKKVVRQMSVATSFVLVYVFLIIYLARRLPAFAPADSMVDNMEFETIFGQSGYLIFGSIAAFLFSQFLDITLFSVFRRLTGGRYIWLRATGSTIISQFLDSIIVIGIGFYLPGKVSFEQYEWMVLTGYVVKLVLAVLLTPFIYLGHYLIGKYLGAEKYG